MADALLRGVERDPEFEWPDPPVFPFTLPAVAGFHELELHPEVTFLVGENGSGKSTLLEAIAAKLDLDVEGGDRDLRFEDRATDTNLHEALRLVRGPRPPSMRYFLRAESFFNVANYVDSGDIFAPDLSLYGDVPLHEQSHGQSFLALAGNRFGGEGLYILDEPEAALSVSGALALVAIVTAAARNGAQFIVATHSPILLACPGARIYELDERGLSPCAYDDVDAVRLTRGFLEAPERYLRAALDADDAAV
jgi:predicted ATPase